MRSLTMRPRSGVPWAPYVPDEAMPWDLRRVVHLHRRAGFAATWDEIWRDLNDGPEASINRRGFQDLPPASDPSHAEIVADAAYHAARAARVRAIVVFTSSGSSARLVSRYRPPVPIYAVTPSEIAAHQLLIHYGVFPVLAPEVGSTDEMLAQMDRVLIEQSHLRVGDIVVFVAGQPVGRPGTTNLMKLHRIGELR